MGKSFQGSQRFLTYLNTVFDVKVVVRESIQCNVKIGNFLNHIAVGENVMEILIVYGRN